MSIAPARRASIGAVLALVGGLALSGCSLLADNPVRDDETGEITEASEADVTTIKVGDCLDAAALGTVVESVPTKPCSEAHDAEVFAAKDLADGDYPADIATQADEFCLAEFETYVGLSYDESELNLSSLYPEAQGWAMGDHEVVCLAILDAGGLTETVKGSKR